MGFEVKLRCGNGVKDKETGFEFKKIILTGRNGFRIEEKKYFETYK